MKKKSIRTVEIPSPCPFCGSLGRDLYVQRTHPDFSDQHVKCEKCDAQGPERDSGPEAIEAWNSRIDERRYGGKP